MASKRYLGIFFGSNSLSIVETENQIVQKFFTIPLEIPLSASVQKKTPDDKSLAAILPKALREKKITTSQVNLSLPSKDIIFRSFTIPWMNPQEIKGVVEFESRKYIPFKLAELVYTFHTITINEKTSRFIRILFAAIRNDLLENYCSLLEGCGLHVVLMEPASLSLVRALVLKKFLARDKRIVIIQMDSKEGKIIVVNQGIPQFIRDFPMLTEVEKPETDKEILYARLFNEIRISLDYYGRQYMQEKMDGIMILSTSPEELLAQNLEKEFGLSTQLVNSSSLLNTAEAVSWEVSYAYGIGLASTVSLPANFAFSRKPIQLGKIQETEEKIPVNLQSLTKVAAVCALLAAGAFFMFNRPVQEQRSKFSALYEKQKSFQGLTKEDIEQKSQEISRKLTAYKNVRSHSEMTFFLTMIPRLLPQGVWLKDFSIRYLDMGGPGVNPPADQQQQRLFKVFVGLAGYAFHENANQQIRLVNSLVSNLKGHKDFAPFFDDIDLVTAQSQFLGEHPVTYFRIDCK